MSPEANKPGGIFASVRSILDGGSAIAENRVELFAVELHQEKCRLVESLIRLPFSESSTPSGPKASAV